MDPQQLTQWLNTTSQQIATGKEEQTTAKTKLEMLTQQRTVKVKELEPFGVLETGIDAELQRLDTEINAAKEQVTALMNPPVQPNPTAAQPNPPVQTSPPVPQPQPAAQS